MSALGTRRLAGLIVVIAVVLLGMAGSRPAAAAGTITVIMKDSSGAVTGTYSALSLAAVPSQTDPVELIYNDGGSEIHTKQFGKQSFNEVTLTVPFAGPAYSAFSQMYQAILSGSPTVGRSEIDLVLDASGTCITYTLANAWPKELTTSGPDAVKVTLESEDIEAASTATCPTSAGSSAAAGAASTFFVDATAAGSGGVFADSGARLANGQTATVSATGSANCNVNSGNACVSDPSGLSSTCAANAGGATCVAPNRPLGALIAKVGASGPNVLVGDGPVTLSGTGRIWFAYNDVTSAFSDNSGGYSVTITVNPAPPAASGS